MGLNGGMTIRHRVLQGLGDFLRPGPPLIYEKYLEYTNKIGKSYQQTICQAFNNFVNNFQKKVISTVNPYGGGGASEKIIQQIRETSLQGILKKSFYNLTIKET